MNPANDCCKLPSQHAIDYEALLSVARAEGETNLGRNTMVIRACREKSQNVGSRKTQEDEKQMKHRLILSAAITLLGVVVMVGFVVIRALASSPSSPNCDQSLWEHVYHGKFATAKDRLKPIEACKTVTGTLHFVRVEKDGDTHLRLDVDPQFKNLLNEKNANEGDMLVVESMCDNTPTQQDTLAEGVCNGWHQHAYKSSMNGKHVSVTGAYVEDEEEDHGWREIHPVTSIVVVND